MSEKAVTHRHDRAASGRRFVYVVRSRRSGGLSVGINLDPQKSCNFDCVYCEVVDRRANARGAGRPAITVAQVADELAAVLDELRRGPEAPRDIAFAGDGEPSTFPGFLPLSRLVFDARDASGLGRLPVILITNGSGLARPELREAHDLFASRGGGFWIKLDAGTEPFYRAVCRTSVPFERILSNLLAASRRHPVVVQSMFFLSDRVGAPPAGEIAAWAGRLGSVVDAGGAISAVQVCTVARETTEPGVHPLPAPALEKIAATARALLPGVPVETFR
ncbi:MAG: radical SAM protein [Thermoanaerobaculia bacterium]|nr:radical SAM protein [Thermoanaerobaculia bacterium]